MHSGKLLVFSRSASPIALTPFQLDMLKLIALMAMCLDHLNTALGWRSVELWMIGRMAFPLFALVWGYNLTRRPVSQTSLNRLWLWAIVAQPAYWWALKGQDVTFFDLNILFAFAVAGQWVYGVQSRFIWPSILAVVLFIGYLPLSSMSYGLAGIVMLLASVGLFHFKQPERQWMMRGLWMVSVLALNLSVGLIYALAGLLLSVMVLPVIMQTKTIQVDRFLPRYFFTLAYVGHLLVVGGVVWLMNISS
ncbi:type-F conjugative transfer system pilin acetylase TraX [Hafnia sp.]|uniref:type-F conjugative transfer system pilin acetylase TraX n=1 Tax=Hafnia sp. TaxID=1873498 RepID=UPI002FC7722B